MSSDYKSNVSEPSDEQDLNSRGCYIGEISIRDIISSIRFTYRFESLINDIGMLKMVIGKEVELIEEVPNVNAAQGIHLGEGQNTWKAK